MGGESTRFQRDSESPSTSKFRAAWVAISLKYLPTLRTRG